LLSPVSSGGSWLNHGGVSTPPNKDFIKTKDHQIVHGCADCYDILDFSSYDLVVRLPHINMLQWHVTGWITVRQGRIKGRPRGQLPRAPRSKGHFRDDNYLFWIKYSFEKMSRFRSDTRIQISRCCIKYHYWFLYKFDFLPILVITTECKYFRFCSMQTYWNFACKLFLAIVLLAWVWLFTRASRLLHKCHENNIICALKLVLPCLLLSSVSNLSSPTKPDFVPNKSDSGYMTYIHKTCQQA